MHLNKNKTPLSLSVEKVLCKQYRSLGEDAGVVVERSQVSRKGVEVRARPCSEACLSELAEDLFEVL